MFIQVESMDLKEVGARIKARRDYLGMTQLEMSQKIFTSRANYARYESGEVDLNISMIERIGKALRCSMAYILGEDVPDDYDDEAVIASYYRGLPPNQKDLIRTMMQAAHEEAKRSETTHGRKAE